MKLTIHELAAEEWKDAMNWYDQQAPNLGARFNQAVLKQLRQISLHPGWYVREADTYVAYVPKFPYKIYYTFDEERLIVWAVAHMHRKPLYWQGRTE